MTKVTNPRESKSSSARTDLCNHLSDLAKERGYTHEYIAKQSGFERSNVSRMLSGKYSPSLDNLIRLSEVIGYDIRIVGKLGEVIDQDRQPKFMFTIDSITNDIYILHRQYPPCLIRVIQETPVRFILEDIYTTDVDDLDDVRNMPFIKEAEIFWSANSESIHRGN